MNDIAVVMITKNRAPQRNYLEQTLSNLLRGKFFSSDRLNSLTIACSDQDDRWIPTGRYTLLPSGPEGRSSTENAAAALRWGACALGAKWVLFLEDDIDVCDDFLGSVGRFLDKHDREEFRVFSFGAAYEQIKRAIADGNDYWHYPVEAFYGTTCFAVRKDDAKSLADFWRESGQKSAYDLLVLSWMKAHYPEIKFHAASAPCFVQHVGVESFISPGRKEHILYDSWPGRDWSFA